MFGAVGDSENDDGVQIKHAHAYACEHGIPIINLSGEYWIKQTNSISGKPRSTSRNGTTRKVIPGSSLRMIDPQSRALTIRT